MFATAVHDDAGRSDDSAVVRDHDVLAVRGGHAGKAPHVQGGVERRDSTGGRTCDGHVAEPRGGRAGVDQYTSAGLEHTAACDEPVDLAVREAT